MASGSLQITHAIRRLRLGTKRDEKEKCYNVLWARNEAVPALQNIHKDMSVVDAQRWLLVLVPNAAGIGASDDMVALFERAARRQPRNEREQVVRQQIELDRLRLGDAGRATAPRRRVVCDVLYVWSCTNPSIGYVQGMDVVAQTLFEALDQDANVAELYAAFDALMYQLRPFYDNNFAALEHARRFITDILVSECPAKATWLRSDDNGRQFMAVTLHSLLTTLFARELPPESDALRIIWQALLRSIADDGGGCNFQFTLMYMTAAVYLQELSRKPGDGDSDVVKSMRTTLNQWHDRAHVDGVVAMAHVLYSRHHDLLVSSLGHLVVALHFRRPIQPPSTVESLRWQLQTFCH